MDITLDKKGNTEASIKIQLTEADYQPKIDQKIKQYRKQVNLKGFRPGKVPANLIKKMYGRDIKIEEINGLLGESLSNYIKENDIKIVGDPMPDREAIQDIDWENQSNFEFRYDVGFVNDISYDISDTIKIDKYVIPVTEEKLEETIDSLKKRFAETEEIDGASEKDHILAGTLTQVATEDSEVAAEEDDTSGETEGATEAQVLENDTIIDLSALEEEQAQPLIGVRAGDEVFFDIRAVFSEDQDIAKQLGITAEQASDIQGEFSFTVKTVSQQVPAELNQAFYDSVFGPNEATDETSFREKVKEAVQDNFHRESEMLLDRDVRDYLVENTEIELPEEFLTRWVLATNEGNITEEQLDSEFDSYLKEMKWTLISNKIAEDRDIQVEHEEVRQKAAEAVFAQFGGMNPALMNDERFAPIIDNYLQAENGNNYMKHFSQARAEKVIDEIKKNVTVQEKEVSTEEFNEQWKQA